MAELYDQGMDGGDGQDSAADTSAETGLRPVNENGQESWAEDQEPLTRGEYADQVRQDEATGKNDGTHDGQDHDDSDERAAAEDDQEQEELPEPRTRQEVAEEARSGAGPLAHPGSDTQQHERYTGDWPSPEERARLHDAYLGWRNEITSSGREQGTNVIGEKPGRSPGDRSDLPPTGEQIVEMEDPKASRAERARKEFLSEENLGDAFDATDEWAKTGQDLFTRPPTGQHIEVPAQGPEITAVPQGEIDPGSAATAGLVLGILGAEFFRWGKHKVEHMRGRHRASDR